MNEQINILKEKNRTNFILYQLLKETNHSKMLIYQIAYFQNHRGSSPQIRTYAPDGRSTLNSDHGLLHVSINKE